MSANVPPQMTLEALRSVPLFASLGDEAAEALRELLEVRTFPPGRVLFRTGEAGDAMYLIEDGRVRIHIRDEDGDDVTLAELSRGDFFGEMAILDGGARSATVMALTDVRALRLTRAPFLEMVAAEPEIALALLQELAARVRRLEPH